MGIKSEPYLSKMLGINLYSPKDEYDINNPKIVQTINSLTKIMTNGTETFNNTLLSRVIGKNTRLAQEGTIELLESLAKRVASYLRQNELPSVSVDNFNINITQPLKYWKITPDIGVENSVSTLLENIVGYTPIVNPVPSVEDMASDSYFDKLKLHNKWLKENRGEGTKYEYEKQIIRNTFNDTNNVYSEGLNSRENIYKNGLFNKTNDIKYNDNLEDKLTEHRGVEYPSYYPNSDINDTIDLNNRRVGKIGDTINPYAVAYKYMKDDGTVKNISKGSGVYKDNESEEYLRVFTELNQYDSPRKALKYNQPNRGNSTLKTVFPTIAPFEDNDYKKLMFSITNLSLRDVKLNGNGSSLDEKSKSDTMWFVPYGLKLNENVSVNWNKHTILGRSEGLYTYNGTDRKCTISFILIADYPADLNNMKKWGNATNNDFNKFFRVDNDLNEVKNSNKDSVDIKNTENTPDLRPKEYNIDNNPLPSSNPIKYYFDNDDYTTKSEFNNDDNLGTGKNGVANFNSKINDVVNFLNTDEGKCYKIILKGHSSSLYKSKYNTILSYKRAYSVYNLIKHRIQTDSPELPYFNEPTNTDKSISKKILTNDRYEIIPVGESDAINTNELDIAMVDRYVSMHLEFDSSKVVNTNNDYSNDKSKNKDMDNNDNDINTDDDFRFKNPDLDMIIDSDFNDNITSKLLKTYSNNIKYFRPVYHSQTPIDLNERVTFLQQCCRQGEEPTSINIDNNISNSIFGRPPVCVLRLGDFLHTKILIESLDLDYEPLWDSNPEGLGMQPMICHVTMSCIIIGGSSLAQPINDLQNALARNYYANTVLINKGK